MLDSLLQRLAQDPAADVDLAHVALLLAADEYPDLDVDSYLARLDDLADRAGPHLAGSLTQVAAGLAHFLFEEEAFAGNTAEYYDPRNSYLNDVLDRKLGIPITLSVLAMAIGRRTGLEVYGVGLPGHFIAKVVHFGEEVLFDPFHGGQLLSPQACEKLIETVTGRPFVLTPELLEATPPGMILLRMLNNLRGIYAQREDFARTIRVLNRQRQLSPGDLSLRRDLGVTMVRAGKHGPAIDHLKTYLESAPYAEDAEEVRQALGRALAEVARWN
jgi:regulator of sirC expression with transglutaminase-like and TPR domain